MPNIAVSTNKTVKRVDHRAGETTPEEKRKADVWTTDAFEKQVEIVGLASKRVYSSKTRS